MSLDHSQQGNVYARLLATYQFEWHSFTRETRGWQLLKEGERRDSAIVAEAEALALSAEERYREARNKLAEYVMEHTSTRTLVVA